MFYLSKSSSASTSLLTDAFHSTVHFTVLLYAQLCVSLLQGMKSPCFWENSSLPQFFSSSDPNSASSPQWLGAWGHSQTLPTGSKSGGSRGRWDSGGGQGSRAGVGKDAVTHCFGHVSPHPLLWYPWSFWYSPIFLYYKAFALAVLSVPTRIVSPDKCMLPPHFHQLPDVLECS